jgi:hypothetical protein
MSNFQVCDVEVSVTQRIFAWACCRSGLGIRSGPRLARGWATRLSTKLFVNLIENCQFHVGGAADPTGGMPGLG